ncbi:MAG: carbohydrate ABC transporter permease [Devosia sp.]
MASIEAAGSVPLQRMAKRSDLMLQRLAAARWFLLPMLVALAIVAGWPLLRSIWFSFTDAKLNTLYSAEWIGFGNYLRWTVLDSGAIRWRGVLADPDWWNAVWNTMRFAFISVSLEAVLGMLVALVLNAEFKGRGIVRAAILIPWAIPTIVSAKMWSWMLNDQLGIINDLLLRLGLIQTKIAWTASVDTAMTAVLVVDIWKTTPFMALLILAGLQMIPKDVYEAAKVDGVHPVKVFFRVTLPLVRPALMVAIIFRLLDAMRIFDLIYVLTPNSKATKTMSILSQENLFQFDNFAEGSTQSTLLFVIIAILTGLYIWLGRVNFDGESK